MAAKQGYVYKQVITNELKTYLGLVMDDGIDSCNEQLALVTHAKIAQSLSNEKVFDANDRKILAIAQQLAEEDDAFSPEYLERLRHKLRNLDEVGLTGLVERLSKTASTQAISAVKQMEICKKLFEDLFQLQHKPTTALVGSAMQQMVMQAGMNVKLHNQLLKAALKANEDLQDMAHPHEAIINEIEPEPEIIRPTTRVDLGGDDYLIGDSTDIDAIVQVDTTPYIPDINDTDLIDDSTYKQ